MQSETMEIVTGLRLDTKEETMKKICLILLGLLIPISLAYGEFTVFYDKDTNEILFVSKDKKNVVLSESDSIKLKDQKMIGDIKDYPLQYPIEYYKLINKTFVVNTQKLSNEANQGTANAEKETELSKVKLRAYYNAYLDLIKEIEFKHLTEADFKQ